MQVWNVLHAARWKCRTQKIAKNRRLGTIAQLCRAISSQLRHISTIKKYLLCNNISSTCPHNMVNFSLLAAEIVWLVWGTPANFNGFRVLASFLQRRRSTEANQTLHNVWPLPGLVDYLYIFGGCCPYRNFARCKIHFESSKSCALLLAALLHGSRAVGASQTLRRW